MEADSTFRWVDLSNATGVKLWEASPEEPSSPIDIRIDNSTYNYRTPLRLIGQRGYSVQNGGKSLAITFRDMAIEVHPHSFLGKTHGCSTWLTALGAGYTGSGGLAPTYILEPK